MNALEKLKSVLCSPDGEVCIHGSEEDRRIVAKALSELQSAPVAQKVPDGFVLVPKEPTLRMIQAGVRLRLRSDGDYIPDVYRAMLAAAQAQEEP